MPRSPAVREKCLESDGYRCQICGYDGRDEQFRPWVVPHHGVAEDGHKLGMGGSTEEDRVENTITLCSGLGDGGLPPNRKDFLGPNEGSCHTMVEAGKWIIARWERKSDLEHLGNDWTIYHDAGLEVLDAEGLKIPHELLWFYRRQEAEELEKVEETIQGVHKADGGVAYALWRLWKNDAFKALDPDAKSFKAYCEARDWRTSSCEEMAETYDLAKESDFEWLANETMRAFKKRARVKGVLGNREYFYVKIPRHSWLTGARPEVYYRTADEQGLRDTMEFGDRLYKMGKTVWGLRAKGGELFDPEGNKVTVIHFGVKEDS